MRLHVYLALAKWPQHLEERNKLSNYTLASRLYRSLGWEVVAPARPLPESKRPDTIVHDVFGKNKFTGNYNSATKEQMDDWEINFPDRNCLLKMNPGIIGIDIDQYSKWSDKTGQWIQKRGYESILEDIVRYGDLEPTFTSTSRGANQPSRIHFYQVDEGIEFNSVPYTDVELIQLHHRYAVVWPSKHPETGQEYKWYGPDGQESAPPRPSDISRLPREWYEPLMASKRKSKPSTGRTRPTRYRAPYSGPPSDWMESLSTEPMDFPMSSLLAEFLARQNPHVGHDELLTLIGRIHYMQFVCGYSGAREVFEHIAQTYLAYTNELDPQTELFNIIRYVAGEEFIPCPAN